jgi:S-formylglutathione hydrolase
MTDRRPRLLRPVIIALFVLFVAIPVVAKGGTLDKVTMHSTALENNLLRDAADRSVYIYLPPSYATERSHRFPTVYLLHGVGDSNADWISGQYQGLDLKKSLDELISDKKIGEMIVVLPDARNSYDGCFYTNSPVTGNWEDFVVDDLVHFVDSHYRTINSQASRGLAGHSMGGYAAIKFGMKHPDIFGSIYAMSACCFAWSADLTGANPAWPRTLKLSSITPEDEKAFYPKFFISLATAWSPNLRNPPFYVDLPFELVDGSVRPKEPAYSEWAANLLLAMAGQYRTNLARLRAIGFDYGSKDQFRHIPLGAKAFKAFLDADHIRYKMEEYDGDHFDHVRERIEKKVLPFFSEGLSFRAIPERKHRN